jgi:small subunit ribosomal protein S5
MVESNLWQKALEKQDLNSKKIMYQNYKNAETVKPGGLELKDRLVGVQRVTKVTKGGRAFGFSAIVVVGDENGVVGHGLGKSKEVATAISKAIEDAKKNLVRIPLNKGTLPHEQKGKFGGARVYIQPASHGTGVIAGGAVRSVLEAVGVHDVLSKSQGSSNPHNVVKATFDALLQIRDAKTVASQRGVSLEKVFKG